MSAILRVVLDTNVLISGFAYPGSVPAKIVGLTQTGACRLVLSRFILDELARVLPRIKKARLTEEDIQMVVESLLFAAEIVEPAVVQVPTLRDRADGPVLGTLLAGRADYLITGDKDLLALAGKYPVVTPAWFWERHG